MTFSIQMCIMCVMRVQCFEPQGRHFTNFPYYYYQLLFLLWQLILGYKLDKSLLPPKKLFGNQTEAFIKKRQQELQVYLQTVLHYLAHHPPPALTFFLDFHLYVSILLSVFVFHLRHLQCIQVSWDFNLFTLTGSSCHKYCHDMCIVVTKHVFRRDKSMLVVTKKNCVCHMFGNTYLLQQIFCFVAASILLSRKKTCLLWQTRLSQ